MKLTNKLLILAAFFLVLPLIFAGNAMAAGAGYVGDGASWDSATHGWKVPPIGANGCIANASITNSRDCATIRYPSYTTSAACSASAEFIAGKAQWTSVCTAADGVTGISMRDVNKNALECNKKGGATYASACVGYWKDPYDLAGTETYQCLRCHENEYQRNSNVVRWKTSYLKTGHKNMLRKVTAGQPWAGPDGVDYAHDGSNNTINWTTATVSGTAFSGARQAYYIYGDWMAPAISVVYDSTAAGTAGYAKYSCASCHTTGYIATNFVTTKQPYLTYPGLNSGITGSWDQDGIVCSRCHNSVLDSPATGYTDPYRTGLAWGSNLTFANHHGSTGGTMPKGADVNALCIECHNSTQTKADPAGQLKTAASGAGFSGHILGNQFLNSTHGRFTGTSGQVGTAANYGSAFGDGDVCKIIKTGITTGQTIPDVKTEADCAALVTYYAAASYTWTAGTNQGNCATCHDVHQSIVPEVGAHEPLRKECTTCHTDKPFGAINHPTVAGTPVGLAGGENSVACEVCHMATESPEGSTHLPVHLWRINTDATYRTFPTSTEWSAGTKIANTAPDGDYANAVWVDLDLACGQCHGGSAGVAGITNGAPYLSKATAAMYAPLMHAGGSIQLEPVGAEPVLPPSAGCDSTLTAAGSMSASTGTVGQVFTLTDSTLQQGHDLHIYWGDGTGIVGPDSIPVASVANGANTHSYNNIGTYQIIQTVTNPCGYRSQKIHVVTVTGGTTGKGTMTLSATPTTGATAGSKVSYSVLNSAGVSLTNGTLTVGGASKVITLDGETYGIKIGYSPVALADPLVYKSCDTLGFMGTTLVGKCVNATTGQPVPSFTDETSCEAFVPPATGPANVWQVTGQQLLVTPTTGIPVVGGADTAVTLTCN